MNIKPYIKIIPILVMLVLVWACSSDDTPTETPVADFDRQAMLLNWADNIIVPSFEAFQTKMNAFESSTEMFVDAPNEANLVALRSAWREAYIAWQYVSMFEIGPAENNDFRNRMNIYPTNINGIENNIAASNYDLTSVSSHDEIGFPAVDYLINGISGTDATIVAVYSSAANAENYKNYLQDVVSYMQTLTSAVVNEWASSYRDVFVSNDDSSANGSVSNFVNDYIFYYEKALRAGKIGIPAGVFANTTLPNNVEALYDGELSKQLFDTALNAVQNLFVGKHFTASTTGESLSSYLDFLNSIKSGEDLSTLINNQFSSARVAAASLNDNFAMQIESNNTLMLATYGELQTNVVLLKVDMLQALDINVDFVDADGD